MTQFIIKKTAELSPDNSVFNFLGFSGTAAPNTTTNIDYKFTGERWLTGGVLYVSGGVWGDTVTIQIIDKDNVLGYGANAVLREFVTNMVIQTDREFQQEIQVSYVSLIPANIYIRIKYTNTALVGSAKVGCNMFTHVPTA